MKKAIQSKYTKNVTVVERADWSIRFYDVETGRHYTRRVWYPVHGSDIYVQHRGGFYSIATEFEGRYNPQAISMYEVVSADELETMTAEIIAHRAGKQYADGLTWEEATRVYAYAIICNDADTEATMTAIVNGILQDRSKQPTQQATETTRAAADRAARALINAYAEATGETITEDDPETAAAYQVARARIIHDARHQCDEYDYMVDDMVEAIARSVRRHPRTMNEIEYTASEAVSQLMSAYAETIGCSAYDISGDVWQAAYHVAAVDIIPEPERPAGYTEASADDRATVSAIVDTIAQAAQQVSAAEAMNEANEAMHKANEAMHKAEDAAITYDAETAAAFAAEARAAADRAEQAANRAWSAATTPAACTLADIASEYAASARAAANRATETAEANARELEQRAEIIATISDPAEREHIANEADRYQWTPEETREIIEYRAIIRTANRAAAALMSAYAEASGENLTEDDDETRAAYLVARDEITGTSERASDYDRAMVDGMVQTIAAAVAYMRPFAAADRAAAAFVAAYAEAIGDTIAESDPEARAAQAVARAEIAGSHASYYDRAMVRDMLEAIARRPDDPEPAPVYQRYELDAYLGDPDAYDVDAIEAEATACDPKTGARVWSAFGDDLAAIAERHELYEYAPAI